MVNQKNYRSCMCELQQAAFVVDDLKLYLDTHPCDAQALEAYSAARAQRQKAIENFEKNVGPLYAENVENIDFCDGWSWVEGSWPWEGEV